MKTILACLMGSLFLGSLAGAATDIYVQRTHLGEKELIFYVGYQTYNAATPDKNFGYQLMPMNIDVARTVVNLNLEQVYKCQGEFLVNNRQIYLYTLESCK